VFCEESYNVFPKKLTKKILEKIITKKNHVGKHCSNPHCFVTKATVLSPYDLALHVKKKHYKAKFSTSSILKK
jgi:hypothetical protein